jgi:predicted transcriptional regulator
MTLREIVRKLDLTVVSESSGMDAGVPRGYASDLLSDVIANALKDDVWVTIQVHPNIIAVAVLKEIAGIIVAGGRKLQQDTVEAARKQNVALMASDLPVFEIAGRLHAMGVAGR